jgi:hypothetical protein
MRELSLRNTVSSTVSNSFSSYFFKKKIILEVNTNRSITMISCISKLKGKN